MPSNADQEGRAVTVHDDAVLMVAASVLNGELAVVNAYAAYGGAERVGKRVTPGAWALAGSCGTITLATIKWASDRIGGVGKRSRLGGDWDGPCGRCDDEVMVSHRGLCGGFVRLGHGIHRVAG